MQKSVAAVCITLGVLAIPVVGYWSLIGLAFGAFDRDGPRIMTLLVAGPLSILPAGILGRRRPLTAGAWLIAGAVFAFFWHLLAIIGDGFGRLLRSNPSFEAWIPVAVICIPMLLLGLAFLWSGRDRIREAVRRLRETPRAWPRIKIVAGIVAAGGVLWFGYHLLSRPIWTVVIAPVGERSMSFSVDARGEDDLSPLREGFSKLFRDPPASGKKTVGTYEVIGPTLGHGWRARIRYECVVDVTPAQLAVVYRNGVRFTTFETREECMAAARRGGVLDLYNTMIANGSWPGRF
jgi:hypothetical protein